MNFIGKILVMLILVMSLVFMSFAVMVYGTHKNWREVVESKEPGNPGLNQQLAELKDKNTELEERLEKLRSQKDDELKSKADAIVKLNEQKTTVEKENAQLVKERDAIAQKEADAVAALDTSSQNEKKLTDETAVLRKEIREAQSERDKQFASVVKLTEDVHKARGDLARLQEREKQLVAQIAHAQSLLANHGQGIDSPLDTTKLALRGKVLAVNDEKMLEVSIGSDDGLKVGQTLEVFRGSKYVGRCVVLTTATDRAVARIDPNYTKIPVQKGDDVATRFKLS